ncbi:HTH-type transcriptional regulator GbpR [Pigmentiphaga humi]|uniref:HTH-type transcriptional regulator GbpR n=1 Tax=Pigmentiphaga humi TaxID=2478468 RepID=A0A3P4B6L8_9BURK|nr:LysR family transcriptional regulator [Pigmentiphaga humi]VCU70825.1 HTH-type transcriptional regulator GbpR [Pigmentiphaga humi]
MANDQTSFRISQLRFRNLRLLELIDRFGSIRQAARQLHVTQPTASAMLREIEAALGKPLFVRSRSGMTSTPSVKAILRRVEVIGNELATIEAEAGGTRDILRIGVLPRCMLNIMPAALSGLIASHPSLDIQLTEGTSDLLLEWLSQGRFDCVVGRVTRDAALVPEEGHRFRVETLYDEGMCIVVARSDPLAARRKLALSDLAGRAWVLPPPGSVTSALLVDEFLHAGLPPPQPVIRSSSFLSNLSLVEQGGLITASPTSAAQHYRRLRSIRVLPIELSAPLPPISLILSRHRAIDGPLKNLRKELLRAAGQLRPAAPEQAPHAAASKRGTASSRRRV